MKNQRKIYTKVVFNMATGETVEEESFNYTGPMALCDGDGNGGDGGGSSPEWAEALPQDVREWDEVKNSDSSEKFWDQMVNMRSRMGSSIRIPGADAGEDDKNAFYTKLREKVPGLMVTPNFDDESTLGDFYDKAGRPKEAKDYTVPEFKDSKDQPVKNIDMTAIEAFKEQAHKAGLSQKQFTDAVMAFVQPVISKMENSSAAAIAEKVALEDEWGTATERNTKVVENFLKHTDAPEAVLKALEAGMIDKTSMVWFHNMATQSVKNGNFQEDDSNRGVMTPEEATMKISEIRNNSKHPYNNRMDPGHDAAKRYMRELYLLKNPKTGKQPAPGTGFPIGGAAE